VQLVMMLILLILAVSVVFFILGRRILALQAQLNAVQQQQQTLHSEVAALLVGAAGVGNRVKLLEKGLHKQAERQEQMALDQRSPDGVSVKQAVELARKGATVDELVSLCGLSRGEAELLSTLHKSDHYSSPSPS